jgi:hypothetical protein
MIEGREDLRFTAETSHAFRIVREAVRQDLDRHLASELCVVCAVHLAHAAGRKETLDSICPQGRTRIERAPRGHQACRRSCRPGLDAALLVICQQRGNLAV